MQHLDERGPWLPKNRKSDRRSSARFPIAMQLEYTTPRHDGEVQAGSGCTIDLSSSGLSFTADRPLPPGCRLEVSIDWPVMLDGNVKLQLVIHGVVVRADGTAVALEIQKHEFKTRRVGTALRQLGT